jgi:hypothetical protein
VAGSAWVAAAVSMTGRPGATALGKLTWAFAIAFLATSITLTIIAAQNSAGESVLDRIGVETAPEDGGDGGLLPPPASDLLPPASERCAGPSAPRGRVGPHTIWRIQSNIWGFWAEYSHHVARRLAAPCES